MPCNKIQISGSVYKTGFRYYLKAKADFSGVTGVVFYEDDKSVGVIASGSEENINKFQEFCKEGFSPVHIDHIKIIEIPYQEFSSFEVIEEKPEVQGMPND
ncbi:MAG: acylphosphatase [Bacteroidales bacterium]|nr:acylphosphatase [Bacteroidales bacterium]